MYETFYKSSCHKKSEKNNWRDYSPSLGAWLGLEKHYLATEPVDTIVYFAPAVLGSCNAEKADGWISPKQGTAGVD
jgi:hypothetical protein